MGLTTTELNYFNVIQPIPIFLIWGGIFAVFTLILTEVSSKWGIIYKLIFIFTLVFTCLFLFIVFWIYFFCLGGQNIQKACVVTSIILFISLIPVFLFLWFTKSFVSVFANSIGYLYYSIKSKNLLNEIFLFNNPEFNNNEYYNPNKNILLTRINDYEESFNQEIDVFNKLYNNINININDDKIDELQKIVSGKNTIGMLCWFYIATVFTSIISIKYLSTI